MWFPSFKSQNPGEISMFGKKIGEIFNFGQLLILTYWSSSCITALIAWLERHLHIIRSLAATSASSTVQPKSILLMSFWITAHHEVFGRPVLRFPWAGFQRYSFLEIRSISIRCIWPNMTKPSWGCFVLDLLELFVICRDRTTRKIVRWWFRVSLLFRGWPCLWRHCNVIRWMFVLILVCLERRDPYYGTN